VVSQNVFFNNGMDRNVSHSLRGNITVDASTRFFGTHGNSIVNNTAIVSNVGASAGTLGTGPFGFEVSSPTGLNSYGGNKLLIANSARASMHNYNWWNTRPIPPTQGNDIAFWNGNSNPNRVHTAPDQFGSVTISNAAGAPPMDFILPTGYQIPVLYNGAVLTLYGWRADKGLYGTFPGGAESSKGTIVPTVGPALIDSPVAVNGVVKAATSESQPKSPLVSRLGRPRGVAALAALPGHNTYTTNFTATEKPISEGGHWISGGSNGKNGDIYTTPGFAQGTPGTITYGDPVAVLTGTWGPNQMAQATVKNPGPWFNAPEVEIHLRYNVHQHAWLRDHSVTGANFRAGGGVKVWKV
jgi:hypothetical protein